MIFNLVDYSSMGRRKGLRATSTDFNEPVEDHGEDNNVEDHDAYETESHHTSKMQGAIAKSPNYLIYCFVFFSSMQK